MNRPVNRVARVERLTHETQLMVELDLDGIGIVEAQFKAVARALRAAAAPDPRAGGIPSTKGVLG